MFLKEFKNFCSIETKQIWQQKQTDWKTEKSRFGNRNKQIWKQKKTDLETQKKGGFPLLLNNFSCKF